MKRTTTKTARLVKATPAAQTLPAIVGADGIFEPEVVDTEGLTSEQVQELFRGKVRMAVIGGKTARAKLPEGTFTIRELMDLRDERGQRVINFQADMEYFVNGLDATLDSIVQNGDAVVGLDRFAAGIII